MKFWFVSAFLFFLSACQSMSGGDSSINLSSMAKKKLRRLDQVEAGLVDNVIFTLESKRSLPAGLSGKQHFDLAILYMLKEKWRDAYQNVGDGRGKTGDYTEAARIGAEIAMREGKLEKALAIMENNGGLSVKNAAFLNTLGIVHYVRGQFADAEFAWTQAEKHDPNDVVPKLNRKMLALRGGRADRASLLDVADLVEINEPLDHVARAFQLLHEKQYSDARSIFQDLYDETPTPNLAQNIGYANYKLGNFDEALSSADSVLKDARASTHLKKIAEQLKLQIELDIRNANKAKPVPVPDDDDSVAH